MIKIDGERIEIYEDMFQYTMMFISGILISFGGIATLIGLYFKGNKDYIGTYITLGIVTSLIIIGLFAMWYGRKNSKKEPRIEVIITGEYTQWYTYDKKKTYIRKILLKDITDVRKFDDWLILKYKDEERKEQQLVYGFSNEDTNLNEAYGRIHSRVKRLKINNEKNDLGENSYDNK